MQEIVELWVCGQEDEARARLRARVAARQDEVGGHAEEAALCERLGLSTAAVRAWQLAARDEPGRVEVWAALARLHEERGERAQALACQERLAALGQPVEALPEAEPEVEPPGPSDADCVRFAHLFRGREGVHARMWADPSRGVGYSPVPRTLTPDLARAHLSGAMTLGAYPVDREGQVGWFVLDLDLRKAALERARGDGPRTRQLHEAVHAEGLLLLARVRALGLAPLYEDSGYKGRHVWCFVPEGSPAAEVWRWGQAALGHLRPAHPDMQLEFFPKQGAVEPDGVGNLVKLPLGVHLRSGRRSVLLDDAGRPLRDPFAALVGVQRRPLPPLGPPPDAPLPAGPSRPAVVPAPAGAPEWTEADFDTAAEVGAVLRGCGVLREVVDTALRDRALEPAAALALTHTLGHLPEGVRACNHLFDRVPGYPAEGRLVSVLRGNPVSCSKLRKRLPELVSRVPCDCVFSERAGDYPHPLRHLERRVEPAPRSRSLEELLEAYVRQEDRLREVESELAALRGAVVGALERVPGGRWPYQGGEWRVELELGLPVLRWEGPR